MTVGAAIRGEGTMSPLLTRAEAMKRLRLKPAHFSKLVNGKVKGLPPLPCVRIGRRQLFRAESVEQWIIDVEKGGRCSRVH
jgi:hypothetical protein